MRKTMILLLACATIALSGCAAHRDPIIDMQGVDQDQFDQDWVECEAYTDEVLVTQGIAKGTATGAAIGAVVGAIGGNSRDVAESAGVGGVYGGASSGLEADRVKQQVFKRCMRGRGYRVLN